MTIAALLTGAQCQKSEIPKPLS